MLAKRRIGSLPDAAFCLTEKETQSILVGYVDDAWRLVEEKKLKTQYLVGASICIKWIYIHRSVAAGELLVGLQISVLCGLYQENDEGDKHIICKDSCFKLWCLILKSIKAIWSLLFCSYSSTINLLFLIFEYCQF